MVSLNEMKFLYAHFLVLYRWEKINQEQMKSHYLPSPQLSTISKNVQKQATENSNHRIQQMQSHTLPSPLLSTISNNLQKQTKENADHPPQFLSSSQANSFIDSVFSYSFLIKCYKNHKLSAYHNYKNLKKKWKEKTQS